MHLIAEYFDTGDIELSESNEPLNSPALITTWRKMLIFQLTLREWHAYSSSKSHMDLFGEVKNQDT